jgi:hypothetical protein
MSIRAYVTAQIHIDRNEQSSERVTCSAYLDRGTTALPLTIRAARHTKRNSTTTKRVARCMPNVPVH